MFLDVYYKLFFFPFRVAPGETVVTINKQDDWFQKRNCLKFTKV